MTTNILYLIVDANQTGNNNKLISDTDSFLFAVETDSFQEAIRPYKDQLFDLSNYPKGHPSYSVVNKSTPGYFKDEVAGKHITSFVGLRSKVRILMFKIIIKLARCCGRLCL